MIHTRRLTRHFVSKKETVEAVRGVADIDVAAGELVAFLGPNGAGKSTTLRMLTTCCRPPPGRLVVAGARSPPSRRWYVPGSVMSVRPAVPGTASGSVMSWSTRAASTG